MTVLAGIFLCGIVVGVILGILGVAAIVHYAGRKA